ncbi:polyphenol oxidase family protein, partial [Pseudomonas aeruginosa]
LWEGAVPPWSQRPPLPERPPRFTPPMPSQAEHGAWRCLVTFCRQWFQAAGVGPAQIEASAVCSGCPSCAFAYHRPRPRLDVEKRRQ